MLSRVADSLYWINRYVERAENISRFVEVSEAMALDCPPGSAEPWLPLVDASGDRELFDRLYPEGRPEQVVEFLVRAEANPNSVVNCIAIARENARQIRDVITTEMWEQLNDIYWTLFDNKGFWVSHPRSNFGTSAGPANFFMASRMPPSAATSPGNSAAWGGCWSGLKKPPAFSM